jgi:ParB-like chromosome segregation protein Spo0J
MLIEISKIQVKNRIRKDFGDIDGLAESIQKLGLLQPIVVTPGMILIAGERRLTAVKQLGWGEIETTIKAAIDREEEILCEIAENESRKDFTPSERVAYGLELEQIERVKALERMRTSTGGTNPQPRVDRPYPEQTGKTDVIVGEKVGLSGPTYRRAKRVIESEDKEVIDKMDKGEIGIATAYDLIKAKKQEEAKEDKPVMQPDKQETEEKEELPIMQSVPEESGGEEKRIHPYEVDETGFPVIKPIREAQESIFSISRFKVIVNSFITEINPLEFGGERFGELSKKDLKEFLLLVKDTKNQLNGVEKAIKQNLGGTK